MRFIAIDVETANADMASICQIGIAVFSEGKVIEEWSTLIDPEDYFDGMNIYIHGIDESMVKGKPTLPAVLSDLRAFMEDNVVVCHTHFDRIALSSSFKKYELEPFTIIWLDSARVVRRAWTDLAQSGYGLKNVCKKIGYKFRHHDALEDAKAAGHVMLAAMEESKIDLEGWLHRVKQPIGLSSPKPGILVEANPEGDLFGEIIVFTGSLQIPRRDAAALAANVGCTVADGVTKKTTILVVGDNDVTKLAGFSKSTKHRTAERLAAKGQPIRILRESDFQKLIEDCKKHHE